jgi:hypothetical protein
MNINKDILFDSVKKVINKDCKEEDKEILLYLYEKIIYNKPTENCVIK